MKREHRELDDFSFMHWEPNPRKKVANPERVWFWLLFLLAILFVGNVVSDRLTSHRTSVVYAKSHEAVMDWCVRVYEETRNVPEQCNKYLDHD